MKYYTGDPPGTLGGGYCSADGKRVYMYGDLYSIADTLTQRANRLGHATVSDALEALERRQNSCCGAVDIEGAGV